jgi:hypothetical protein
MANKLNGFLQNIGNGILEPKGDMADYQHASRLYVNDTFRLAPKAKFLYHVVFDLNPDAVKIPQLDNRHKAEIGMLVKSVDLPKYSMSVETKQKYNRKKNVQTRLDYDPINMTFHDDNLGITTLLWEAYYRYYFRDGNYGAYNADATQSATVPAYAKTPTDNTYQSPLRNRFRYGLDNDSSVPFFNNIQIFQLSRQTYTGFMLVNPIITSWQHDTMDQSDNGSNPAENKMSIAYESVLYSRGPVSVGSPKNFAEYHYDNAPSPVSLAGGGTATLFGQGGVLAGIGDVFGRLGSGTAFTDVNGNFSLLNTIDFIRSATNTFKNAKDLSSSGIRQEGIELLTSTVTGLLSNSSGVANTIFPTAGTISNTTSANGVRTTNNISNLSTNTLVDSLQSDSSLLNTVGQSAYALGYAGSGGSVTSGLGNFNNLSASEKSTINNEVLSKIAGGDPQVTSMANRIVNNAIENNVGPRSI